MSKKLYNKLTEHRSRHGKCSNWIRENRRRRAAGLPQKRVLKLTGAIFDPVDRTLTKTLTDGTQEVISV